MNDYILSKVLTFHCFIDELVMKKSFVLARRKLNEQFEALAFFKRKRSTTLYHFCAALELIPTSLSDNLDLPMRREATRWDVTLRYEDDSARTLKK